jgi:hypothetical protein
MNLLAYQSGMFLPIWVFFLAFNFDLCRSVCFSSLCGTRHMTKRFHFVDYHERLCPANRPTLSH